MKKTLLLSLFTLLSAAVFAQYGGCGAEPHSSASANTNAYATSYAQPKETVKLDFQVFPNPTTDYFALDALSLEKGNAVRILVYNRLGQQVRTFTVAKNTQYQVSDLRDGMYLVQFLDAQNKTIATRKLYKSDQAARF